MATGAMTGADATALRSLATGMSQSAAQLEHLRARLQSLLGSTNWTGVDAARFRQQWDGQLRSLLHNVEQDLRSVGTHLKSEADQQENASRDDGSGVTGSATAGAHGGSGGGKDPEGESGWLTALGAAHLLHKGLDLVHGGAETVLDRVKDNYIKHVKSATREYDRWAAGHATTMKKYFGTTKDVARDSRFLERTGTPLAVAGAVVGVAAYYAEHPDDGHGHKYSVGERGARAVGATAATTVVDTVATDLAVAGGTAAGAALGGPPGAVIGGAAGFVVANGVEYVTDPFVEAGGAAVGSGVYWVGTTAVDLGGAALHEGGDLLSAGGHGAAHAGHAVSHAASSAGHHVGHAASTAWNWAT